MLLKHTLGNKRRNISEPFNLISFIDYHDLECATSNWRSPGARPHENTRQVNSDVEIDWDSLLSLKDSYRTVWVGFHKQKFNRAGALGGWNITSSC